MQIIDYRSTVWGHNFDVEVQSDGTYSGVCWYRRRVHVGDRMVWTTEYGAAVAEVTAVTPYRNPHDMYHIEVRVVKRLFRPCAVAPGIDNSNVCVAEGCFATACIDNQVKALGV